MPSPVPRLDVTRLSGRVVVITGAGSGIGRETALLCARRGAGLAICDLDDVGLAETATAIRALGAEVLAERVDVSLPQAMEALAASVHDRWGAADVLVNNAGVGVVGAFVDTTNADWERVLRVNVVGVVNGCRAFLPAMLARSTGGHIVNLASAVAFMPAPTMSAYSASKAAVLALSETLRAELRPHGIGVTAVCPGLINTPMVATVELRGERADERRKRMIDVYKRRSYGPERVAHHILRAVQKDRAVAPVAAEAYASRAVSRVPPLARWLATRAGDLTK